MRGEIKGNGSFQLAQGIAEGIQIVAQAGIGLGADSSLLRHLLRTRTEDIGGEHVELRGLVDAFARVLLEENIAPDNQIIEVGHHRLKHKGRLAITSHQERSKWSIFPRLDTIDRILVKLLINLRREIDQNTLNHLDVVILERLDLPETLRGGAVAIIGGIENVVEPLLRILEVLVFAQV